MSAVDSQSDDFDIIDRQEASLGIEALEKLQKWLQPTDYLAESSEFRRHLSSQAPGTGLWICDTEKFQQWHDSADHGSLWIKGVPGAGKSVLAASLVEHLRTQEDVPVLFFFFRYIIAANRRPRSLIRDWLAQLLPHSLRLQASLQSMLACELNDLSDERLWEYLLLGLSSIEKTYCVVDALDEMELIQSDGFLLRLNSLATFRSSCVKLLITSRPKQYLQSSMKDSSIVHISLQDDLVGNDIAHFVSHRLKLAIPENKNAALVNSLLSTICTRSQGLFLYARLLLDQITPILQSEKQVNIEALVKSLPVGLEDMYNSMLFQQSETLKIETAIQVFLLACATHSSRSLRLNELANFLQFRFTRSMAPGTPKAVARAACAPLLEIMEDETVQVIHHSFTEFLLDSERTTRPAQTARQFPILEPQNVHRMLAVACLDYLQSGVLEAAGQLPRRGKACYGNNEDVECDCEKKEGSDKATTKHPKYDYQQARLQYPFLEYGVQNWSFHAGNYDVKDESFFASIKSFAETDSGFRRWLSIVKTDKFLHPIAETPSLLHVAAFAGLAKFANHLLQAGQPVDPRDIEGKTPLLWASSSGHTEMVSILLKHGAVPDAEDECGVKPIHLAARQNYHGIVKMLLEAGVDPITPKTKDDLFHGAFGPGRSQERTKGDTAVQYICRHGHTETILVMLPFLQPETLEEVLCETCRYGKFESARAVLENSDVSVNSQFTGATALHLACIAPNVDCVQMLLEKGADIKLISESKPLPRYFRNGYVYHSPGSALQGLIRTWNDHNHPACVQIFQLLMRAGADLKEKDSLGETPLLSQFQKNGNRSIPAVKTLLAAGASTSDVYQYGDTILHRYLDSNMDIEMLDLLLEHGADVTARGRLGETVLHSLLKLNPAHYRHKYSKKDVIEYFLAKGAQPQVKNESGKSALEAAMLSPTTNLEIFKLLLRYCPDESIRKQCLWLIGSKRGKEQVQFIRELQAASMSLDARTSGGQTVLLSTIRLGDTWKALVECGASLDAIDSRGWGALHHFISSTSSIDQLQELINAGLDPHMADNEGRTLLHIIALHYEGKDREVKLIEFLLSLGLSVNAMTRLGRTPLHLHIEGVPNQVERCSGNEKLRVSLLSIFQKSGYMLDVNIQDNEGLSALHLSAMRSEFDVARLLDAGADFTLVTKAKRSALHLACRARRSGVVGLLLDKTKGQLIDRKDYHNRTALHDACASGRPESVYYLLKHGADIAAEDYQGRTPLHSCAEFASEEKIWSLLRHHDKIAGGITEINNRYRPGPYSNRHWCSAMFTSASNDSLHNTARIGVIVKSLLAAGADPFVLDAHDKLSPLDLALSYGCLEMIQALHFTVDEVIKRKGQDPENLRFSTEVALNQRTPIRCRNLSENACQEILRSPARYGPSLGADDVDWLIQNKANITGGDESINDFDGHTFLHFVASNGLTELMKCVGSLATFHDDPTAVKSRLLKAGYKKPSPNPFIPVLHDACHRELPNMEMVEILVEHCGVDVNARALVLTKQSRNSADWEADSAEGPTALHILAMRSRWWHLDAIRYLVEHGANVNLTNQRGKTPLHIACGGEPSGLNNVRNSGFWGAECAKLLLDLGANPNALDDNGMSPLHCAKINPKAMKILLERGAAISRGKISPLFNAIASQNLESVRILLDAGADPNAKDTTKDSHNYWGVTDKERWALLSASHPTIGQKIEYSASIVKLLIERGANVYNPLNDHETLIHYIFEHAELAIVCAFLGCREMIDFAARDQLGQTVFLAACNYEYTSSSYEHKDLVDKRHPAIRVLECGADPLAADYEGRNALHHLLENLKGEEGPVSQFLKHDACKKLLHQADKKGFTPLNTAFRVLHPAIVEELLELGADLLQPDPNGLTALHQIAAQCFLRRSWPRKDQEPQYFAQCISLWNKYLNLGGDINARDNEGSPPLFFYLRKCNTVDCNTVDYSTADSLKNFEVLLGNADVQVRNNDGETALHVIARKEKGYIESDRELFRFMVAKGLDPLAEDGKGRSSLDVAAACGKNRILDLFQYES